eukprot:TRINITY_DN264_c3_g1_i16.p1 TRINITY_DN264_c3_g1~~TRINITY_DN264_c3_g1_i16.p1  ORF type:complete len:230 (+),score=23.88 TRINITY_DN264_c3_g1_i16:941-1630(+)
MSDESGKYKSLLSFLMKIPLKHWVTAYIEAPNFGHLTNNLVEGHNKVILPARAASGVLTTIDWLRHRDGKFMESTRAKIPGTAGPNDLCTKVTAKLGLITKAVAKSYVAVAMAGGHMRSATRRDGCGDRYLRFFRWAKVHVQTGLYPCLHLAAVCRLKKLDVASFVHPSLKTSAWKQCYFTPILPRWQAAPTTASCPYHQGQGRGQEEADPLQGREEATVVRKLQEAWP